MSLPRLVPNLLRQLLASGLAALADFGSGHAEDADHGMLAY
jgi:hypothetical protein